MNKNCFRLFWSYDIQKTEQWLSEMSSRGYHLEKVDFNLRIFKFKVGTPKKCIYRIAYSKKRESLSLRLENNCWKEVTFNRHWVFLVNENEEWQISFYSSREGILKRNKTIMNITGAILTIFAMIQLPTYIVLGLYTIPLFNDKDVEVYTSNGERIGEFIFLGVLFFCVFTFIKLLRDNKKLVSENVINNASTSHSFLKTIKDVERRKKDDKKGKIIRKIRLGWQYSPDKLEKWLENMEKQGFNLIEINKIGNSFYFEKGEIRKISYVADYQNRTNDDYYEIHRQTGWNVFFTSPFNLTKWTLWAKEYDDGEEKPVLYSTKKERIKQARKMAMMMSICYIPMILISISMIISYIRLYMNWDVSLRPQRFWLTPLIQSILIIEFGTFTIKSILYYFRVKKQ
ncbi:DUF2812 domain-containing protein [Clostridium sp. DL1XJH146]